MHLIECLMHCIFTRYNVLHLNKTPEFNKYRLRHRTNEMRKFRFECICTRLFRMCFCVVNLRRYKKKWTVTSLERLSMKKKKEKKAQISLSLSLCVPWLHRTNGRNILFSYVARRAIVTDDAANADHQYLNSYIELNALSWSRARLHDIESQVFPMYQVKNIYGFANLLCIFAEIYKHTHTHSFTHTHTHSERKRRESIKREKRRNSEFSLTSLKLFRAVCVSVSI